MSSSRNRDQKHILILGAGVTGLSTAIALHLRNPTYLITIIASQIPGDLSIDYTSPWAGGHWRSHALSSPEEAEVRDWDKRTYEVWMSILEAGDESVESIGLGVRESRSYWGKENAETKGGDGRGLWWRDAVRGFEALDLGREKEVPEGAIFGVKYQSVCINVPQHLGYLLERVKKLGMRVVKADVDVSNRVEGVVRDARRLLMERVNGVGEGDLFALVNCTGLGARHFVGKGEADKLFPIRGQTILVKGEAQTARTCVGFDADDELAYVIPRPGSGTTILGGCKQVANWDARVDTELNERIMERIKKFRMAEELRTPEGEFDTVSFQVGFRPGRKGGPRVEVEGSEMVEGVWVVHSYGHSGAGYQNSVGCAEKVARLVSGL